MCGEMTESSQPSHLAVMRLLFPQPLAKGNDFVGFPVAYYYAALIKLILGIL
jgi:hypothetical protein